MQRNKPSLLKSQARFLRSEPDVGTGSDMHQSLVLMVLHILVPGLDCPTNAMTQIDGRQAIRAFIPNESQIDIP